MGFETGYIGAKSLIPLLVFLLPLETLQSNAFCVNLCLALYSFFFFSLPGQYPVGVHKTAFVIGA